MTEGIGIDYNIIAIVVAVGAVIFSAFTFRRNRISEQIKIAREQMDRILTKRQQAEDYMSDTRNNRRVYIPIEYFFRVEDVLKECEYFGYIIQTGEIKNKETIRFYNPRVFEIFSDMNRVAIEALRDRPKLNQSSDIRTEIGNHIKLLDNIGQYWDSHVLDAV